MSSRYSDDPSSNSNWRSGPHRNSQSNPNIVRRNRGNPIGNWIQNRRRNRSSQNQTQSRPVGTEAKALENISKNAQFFNYPPEGFITPIEHSLLYAMILYPEQYPESVVRKEIHDEEFDAYLYVKDPVSQQAAAAAAAAERNYQQQQQYVTILCRGTTSILRTIECLARPIGREKSIHGRTRTSFAQLSIGQTLCRKLLKTVTKYAESHSLDRHREIRELLDPVEKRCQIRNEQAALKQLLPAYAGYTLSLVTGNPLPLLIGAAALVGNDPMVEENENVHGFRGMGGRTADLETVGLLDECEDD
ncbi:hypothetical protein HJC23_013523 [Cyclotella cryptica]|uniref:Uncharacterized protein n=1 Tax=Cyclotella cryptica TaxID=29204 RepID=A0ABD3PA78_9STRA